MIFPFMSTPTPYKCLKTLAAVVIASSMVFLSACGQRAPDKDPRANELFSIAERLEKLRPWTIEGIEKITGRILRRTSITQFASDEVPDDRLMSDVEVDIDPGRGLYVTCVSLSLPKNGLGITLTQVTNRYGVWSHQDSKLTFKDSAAKRFGYRTLVGYEFRRKNGEWWRFDFDDDKTRQLRIVGLAR